MSHFRRLALGLCLLTVTHNYISARESVVETADTVVTVQTTIDGMGAAAGAYNSYSGEFDLKTNLLEDLVGTMSIGGEVKIAPRFSLSMLALWNPWTFKDQTMYKQWSVRPQLRWYPGQKGQWTDAEGNRHSALNGHYLAFNIFGGEYNYTRVRLPFNAFPDLAGHRFEGWFLGGGISYGYRYNISQRFALETSIGLGVAHCSYDKYACGKCGERIGKGSKVYVGPIDASVNLVLRIGRNPRRFRNECVSPDLGRVKVDTMIRVVEKPVVVHDTIVQTIHEDADPMSIHHASFTLRLGYRLNSSEIDRNLGDNAEQIDSLRAFINRYLDNPMVRISTIDINGYASLEGAAAANERLSRQRAEAAAILIGNMYPALGSCIQARGMGEDWASPQFPDKLRLLGIKDLDQRETELRRIDAGHLYQQLLPSLAKDRRIECVINYTYLE